ncbi:hypothetical protein LCGC14_1864290, partial [marine sediment metagenome]
YKTKKINDPELHDFLKRARFTSAQHYELRAFCQQRKVNYLCSAFDEESLFELDNIGCNIIKVPSGLMHKKSYINALKKLKKQIILSTGMSTMGEIHKVLEVLGKKNVMLMHTVSAYPAPASQVNLLAMTRMYKTFGLPVGFSDHTIGCSVPVAAVALGAVALEKHFTLDNTEEGPDQAASITIKQLKLLVSAIRITERAIGDGVKKIEKCEKPMLHRRKWDE